MAIAPTQAITQAASATGTNALSTLSGNFQTFLTLLMTQLQNQDPTNRWTPTSSPASWCSSPASNSRSPPTAASAS